MRTTQSNALLGMYRDVSQYEPPTPDEERDLVLRVAAGDVQAEEELVARNLRLVFDIARRYQTPGATFEDLVQEGAIGLLRAARKFDPGKGNRFSTLAHWWIRQGISRFVKGPTRAVRLPEYIQDRIARTLKARRELSWGREGDPGDEEIAHRVGTSKEDVRKLIEYSRDALSLESSVGNSHTLTVGNTVEDKARRSPEEEVTYRGDHRAMVEGLQNLPARETQILAYRFGLADGSPRSRPWIGKLMGLSAERVRQIEKAALNTLRQQLSSVSFA